MGPFVEIQKEVVIGPRTRVQSHAFICELVTIGADCFISHGAMFINDRMSTGKPAFGHRETWGRTVLGDRVMVGTNATILPVSICSDVMIGAGSVVTSDIGSPASTPATRPASSGPADGSNASSEQDCSRAGKTALPMSGPFGDIESPP